MEKNITRDVWRAIDQELVIQRALELGISNVRAVAFYLIKRCGVEASLEGVMSAVRRYPIEERQITKYERISEVLKDSKISTKTKITAITTKRDPLWLADLFPKIFRMIDASKGEVIRFVEGREALKIIVDDAKANELIRVIGKGLVSDVNPDLCEINVHFGEGQVDIRGIRASLLTELAINDINVIETISCLPEFMLFVKEGDMARAHNLLIKFCYQR